MSTTTKIRKTVKPERRVSLSTPVNGAYALVITIGTGEKAKHFGYYARPIPCDFGLAFHFEKFEIDKAEGEDAEYDVHLDQKRGFHSCTCKGGTYHGHCKHVEALQALIRAGKIDVPTPEPEPDEYEWDNP